MKPMKVAAVVAGSMMALGAAAPAFAADTQAPASLNGALDTLAGQGLRDAKPLNTNALDTENDGSLVNAVKKTADGLNKPQKGGALLGGLPLGK
jgi:ABC-type oligopeptide transport system substrate-binding subunit